jgi:hypothetical protein
LIRCKTNKRPFDDFVFDAFAESDCEDDKTDEAAAAAVGCRKRSRRGDVVINDIVKQRAQPPRSARQTREAQQPASRGHAKLITLHAPGESLAGAGQQVKEILGERQTDAGFHVQGHCRKGPRNQDHLVVLGRPGPRVAAEEVQGGAAVDEASGEADGAEIARGYGWEGRSGLAFS